MVRGQINSGGKMNRDLTIQEVHKYLKLVELGVTKPILCPLDQDHMPMISQYDEKSQMSYFYCLACETKLRLGQNLTKFIFSQLDIFKTL
jgi:hypothetical protein